MIGDRELTVLVVEDELSIRSFIKINLEYNHFKVIEAGTGKEALELASKHDIGVTLLDVNLPDMEGFEILQVFREQYTDIAVLMLTARSQDMDKVMGLELGADDYIIKPFNPMELVARIRAVLRRMKPVEVKRKENKRFVEIGNLLIDLKAQRIQKNGWDINLTPREFTLLAEFMERPNEVLKRDDILDLVWGADYVGDPKTVDVHVRRLREKIEDDPSHPAILQTVWGVGYCFRWDK